MLTVGYAPAATQQNAGVPGLTVLDMGQHMLPKVAGAHLIVQVLVPGLEERAHAMPPLSSVAMSPGEHCALPVLPQLCDDGSSLLADMHYALPTLSSCGHEP